MTNSIMTFLRELEKQIKEIREQLTRIEVTQAAQQTQNQFYDFGRVLPNNQLKLIPQAPPTNIVPGGSYSKCSKCQMKFKDMTNYCCGQSNCPLRTLSTLSVSSVSVAKGVESLDLRLKHEMCTPTKDKC
jgi:hypothetical protein